MNILIATANQEVIKKILPKVKFKKSTTYTSTFRANESTFQKLYEGIESIGYNPYALMSW